MILDKVKNIDNYKGIIPELIIQKVKKAEGKEVELKSETERDFEFHKNHKDLFVCLDGIAMFHYLFQTEYDKLNDIQKSENLIRYTPLQKGEFLIIDENVLHRPNLVTNKQIPNQKAVIEVFKIEV
jgi:beta-galactosidase beta subunit